MNTDDYDDASWNQAEVEERHRREDEALKRAAILAIESQERDRLFRESCRRFERAAANAFIDRMKRIHR